MPDPTDTALTSINSRTNRQQPFLETASTRTVKHDSGETAPPVTLCHSSTLLTDSLPSPRLTQHTCMHTSLLRQWHTWACTGVLTHKELAQRGTRASPHGGAHTRTHKWSIEIYPHMQPSQRHAQTHVCKHTRLQTHTHTQNGRSQVWPSECPKLLHLPPNPALTGTCRQVHTDMISQAGAHKCLSWLRWTRTLAPADTSPWSNRTLTSWCKGLKASFWRKVAKCSCFCFEQRLLIRVSILCAFWC